MPELVKLGDYITEYSVRNKTNEDIPVYSVTNTKGFCTEYFDKDVSSKDQTNYKIVPRGYFAYNPSRINVGSIDFQKVEEQVVVSPLYVVFGVDERIDREYLLNYLKSDIGRKYITELASGSVRANLKFSILKEFEFPYVPIDIQRDRMKKLSDLNHSISLCDELLEKLDFTVKARFVEMFGDLANPECEYYRCELADACVNADDIKCGPFGTQLNKDEYQNSGVAIWEIPQINSGFKEKPTHYLTEEKAEILDAYSLVPGDIAMSRKGNVGRCGLFPDTFGKGIMHSDVLRIRVDRKQVNPYFMMCQLHFSKDIEHQIEMVSSGAVMAGINVTKLKHINVYLPPLELQNKFVDFVQQVDKSKLSVQQIRERLEVIQKSLLQEYYS